MSKPPPCPKCGSKHVVHIAYGFPNVEMGRAVERGEIVLGGCVIDQNCRSWSCTDCNARFNDGGADLLEPVDYYAEYLRAKEKGG